MKLDEEMKIKMIEIIPKPELYYLKCNKAHLVKIAVVVQAEFKHKLFSSCKAGQISVLWT